MDEFLTFLYKEYFAAKAAVDKVASGDYPIPADRADEIRALQERDRDDLRNAERRLKRYMRASFSEIKRMTSG